MGSGQGPPGFYATALLSPLQQLVSLVGSGQGPPGFYAMAPLSPLQQMVSDRVEANCSCHPWGGLGGDTDFHDLLDICGWLERRIGIENTLHVTDYLPVLCEHCEWKRIEARLSFPSPPTTPFLWSD